MFFFLLLLFDIKLLVKLIREDSNFFIDLTLIFFSIFF